MRKVSSMMQKIVHALPPTASAYDAARKMKEKSCACVVVAGKQGLVGIFTAGDLVKRVAAEKRDPAKTRLSEVMTPEFQTVAPETLAVDALRAMHDGRFRHHPVIEAGRLVGIISRRDFFGQEETLVEDEEHITEVMR
jgi:CBS domain-containing protein